MPSEWFGIQNLTVVQQRIIAIFAFATLMWILEIVSSWATSVAIIVLMLLFCTDSGLLPMVNEEEVGKLLSYKGVMATFADPVIMLFIGGFILAIAATKTGLDAQLARVLLNPLASKKRNGAAGIPAHYGTVLDVRVEHGYGSYDADIPDTRVPPVAARRQGPHRTGHEHSHRCQSGWYGYAPRYTAEHHCAEVPKRP